MHLKPYTTLISAAQLAEHIASPNWVVVDCRHDLANHALGLESYQAGHIPTARFAAIEADLSDKSPAQNGQFRGRHPLPTREAFIATLQSWGIHADTQVVAYDAHGGMFAARLWWMLRWVGHASVAVLDGGLPAWQAQGGALSTDAAAHALGTIAAKPALTQTVDAAEVLANLDTGLRTIIDARAADRFRGENETMDPVGGHIPGAVQHFFKDNLLPDGRFQSADTLRSTYSALIKQPSLCILQCGSGVTACHNLLAMEIAGLSGAALYPGSWSEWCADTSRPVALGG
jgi:thiosulfate/3-mercaptopyruvate sulfurtransferase